MAKRPGMMVYFDILDDFEDYTTDEIGQLFIAMLKYGKDGTFTDFQDRGMKSVWHSLVRTIDRDQLNYDEKVLKTKYAGWRSSQVKSGKSKSELLSFDDWKSEYITDVNTCQQTLTPVNDAQRNQPTSASASASASASSSASSPTPSTTSSVNSQLSCSDCGKPITGKIAEYSKQNYNGKTLCIDCQKNYYSSKQGYPKYLWGEKKPPSDGVKYNDV